MATGGDSSIKAAKDHNEASVYATSSPEPKKPPSEVALDPSWRDLFTRIYHLAPHLWPSQYPDLQSIAFFCLLIVILGRIVNVLAPLTLGALITTFDTPDVAPFPPFGSTPWPYLVTYVALRFLASSGGLAALCNALWIPVMQYSNKSMSKLTFNHILALSLNWHTKRKTGELLHTLDREAPVNRFGELIAFTVLPALLDVAVAVVVFTLRFELALGVVVGAVMNGYIWVSVVLTKYRTRIRKQADDRDAIIRGIRTDCLLNYETVKYFGGEEYEARRYAEAIREYQTSERGFNFALNLLVLLQTLILTLGLLVSSIIVSSRITRGESSTSDFVVFIAYYAQLYFPLSQFGTVYRSINQSLIDTEKLLNLLAEPTEVVDAPDAKELLVEKGQVKFENVTFSYDGITPVLKNISFKLPPGGRIAFVGESGAGKSTILRLLYRLYDLQPGDGRILIDGQDIRTVKLSSLRNAIGVVPQDPILFDASIGYNIAYGRPSMMPHSQSTIIDAAKAAQMHERIMSFPEGYETKVGERDGRLGDGEKRRLAIARAMVENPRVLLLDEVTSALDGAMERAALLRLVDGRSCLSIPHRLSTITGTDVVVVLKEGRIVEQGSRKELLELNGLFASMWTDQISTPEEPMTYEAPVVDVPEPESKVTEEQMTSPQAAPKEDLGLSFLMMHNYSGGASFSPTPDSPSIDSPGHPERSHAQGTNVTFDAGAINTPPRAASPEPGSGRKVAHGIQRLARRMSISGGGGKGPKLPFVSGHQRDSSTVSSASGSGGASVSPPSSMNARESVDEPQHVEKIKEEKRKKRKAFL